LVTVTHAIVGDKLKANFSINVTNGGSVAQSLEIHTSCSAPLMWEDQFGSMQLVGFVPEGDNGECSAP
jgi:hypothetical protein